MNAARGDLERLIDAHAPVPYVLLLQEADEGPLRRLAAARSLMIVFAPVRVDAPGSRGNAIVSSLPLREGRRIALPTERQPRIAVAAEIEVGGVGLFVASAHLENRVSWWRGGLLSENARGRQAEALLRELPHDRPGILGGDMNTWLGMHEPAWKAFFRRFAATPEQRPVRATFRDRLALDHLFYDLPAGWTASTSVAGSTFGSDHRPVIGRVRPSY
jgi:endonuclease/exonuclease/phosphatase family metal-dependent hydrolase